MKYLLVALLFILRPAAFALAGDSDKPVDATAQHALPDDSKAEVVKYDFSGGMMRRRSPAPALVVCADGSIHCGDPYGAGKAVDGKISIEQLQSLLHEILDVQKFADIDKKDLALPSNRMVTDGQTVSISIKLPDTDKSLSVYGLMIDPKDPADAPKRRFFNIRATLDHLVFITLIGGDAAVNEELDAINADIKKNFPNSPLMDQKDLDFANMRPNGDSGATYKRKINEGGTAWHILFATATRSPDGKLTIEVKPGPTVHDE